MSRHGSVYRGLTDRATSLQSRLLAGDASQDDEQGDVDNRDFDGIRGRTYRTVAFMNLG